jgi:VIT1/CCC1 family predicted Fe2+/Mn2+ transporter
VIIGLSDGLTVPFALTAGLSSIGDSRLVVLGGLAELIAGAISMGVGGFLASQGERDHFRYLRAQTQQRVKRSCEGEMEREVHSILGPLGVDEKISRQVADCLLGVEASTRHDDASDADSSVSRGSASSKSWWRTGKKAQANGDAEYSGLRWSEDVGITTFLLKFGEGMEEVPTKRLYISAFTIGMGYFLGGLIPLLPYFFINPAQTALIYSCVLTGVILLIFGVVKTYVTGAQGGVGGYFKGAVSTMFVGGAAAAAAYGIVHLMEAS